MKEFKLMTGYILVIVGFFLLAISNLVALGTGLYDWAFNMDLAMAAWGAFVLWMQMIGCGAVSLLVGLVLGEGRIK